MYLNIDGYQKLKTGWDMENQRAAENRRADIDTGIRQADEVRRQASFGRLQDQWGREDAGRAAAMSNGAQFQGGMDDATYDWGGKPDASPAGGLTVNRQAVDSFNPDAPTPAGLRPQKTAPTAKSMGPMDDELNTIRDQVKVAMASGDAKQLADARTAYFDHKKRRTAMEIANHLDNADDAEYGRIANKVTADDTHKVSMIYDPSTKTTTLQSDDGTVQHLGRAELKAYLISKALGSIDGMAQAQTANTIRSGRNDAETMKIADENNKAGLTGAHIDYYGKMGDAAGMRAERAGSKADHYDDKAWATAFKQVDKGLLTYEDPDSGKTAESGALASLYKSEFLKGRASGQMSPEEANSAATDQLAKMRLAASKIIAQDKAQNPKSKMTVDQAVGQITANFARLTAQQAQPQQAGLAPPSNAELAARAGAAAPAAQPPAPAGLVPPAQTQFVVNPTLEQQMRVEQGQIANRQRPTYSPEVVAYGQAKQRAANAAMATQAAAANARTQSIQSSPFFK